MLARKQMMSNKQSAVSVRMEKSRLTQARTLALRRQDLVEVRSIDAQLTELNTANPDMERGDTAADVMAMVNERNRKANLEATRKAEQIEAERRKRERKLAAVARASNSPAPSALVALKLGISRYATVVPHLMRNRLTYHCLDPSPRTPTVQHQRLPHLLIWLSLARPTVSKHPSST
jgi:RNA polymerase-associated protein RTF1